MRVLYNGSVNLFLYVHAIFFSLFEVEKKEEKRHRDMVILYLFLCIIFNPPCDKMFSILSISQTIIFCRMFGTTIVYMQK